MLYDHQKKLLARDPRKSLIAWGTGSGKTTVALLLAKGSTLVVCPKTIKQAETWEREAKRLGLRAPHVMTKEEFRLQVNSFLWKKRYDTVILDEAHTLSGASPDIRWRNKQREPRTSALYGAAYSYLNATKPDRLYLLTATPIRSAMSVWALGKLLGLAPDFYDWRSAFYLPVQMNGHERWLPKKDAATKTRLGAYVRKLGATGRLEDWFDVPEQTHRIRLCALDAAQKKAIAALPLEYPDPLVLCGKTHQLEQGESKYEAIEELRQEFGRVLVFARYTAQIEAIEAHCKKLHIPCYAVTGATKDRGAVLSKAEATEECVLVVQSQISAGWEAPSFRCTIFASQDWSVVNHTQAVGRTLRANALSKNLYVYLLSGEVDALVYKAIENKVDFTEKIYEEKRSIVHD